MKKIIGIAAAAVIVLGLSLVIYNQIIPDEYVPADDEIALHLKLDTEKMLGCWFMIIAQAAANTAAAYPTRTDR